MDLKGKLALVTGASGMVGGTVVNHLAALGMEVRVLVRRPVDLGAGITACLGDVRDAAAVEEAVRGAALVVHCAAV